MFTFFATDLKYYERHLNARPQSKIDIAQSQSNDKPS